MNRQTVDPQGIPYSMFYEGLICELTFKKNSFGILSWRVILSSENVSKFTINKSSLLLFNLSFQKIFGHRKVVVV